MPRRSEERKALRLDRSVGARHVVPLRALPFMAPALFRPGLLVLAIADPERHAELGVVLTCYAIKNAVNLTSCAPAHFFRQAADVELLASDAPTAAYMSRIPAGFVVLYDNARRFQEEFVRACASRAMDTLDLDEWTDAPALLRDEWRYVFEGFPNGFVQQLGTARPNSALRHLDEIKRRVDEIFTRAAQAGIPLDRQHLPPTQENFVAALRRLDMKPDLPNLSAESFRQYFYSLGLRFSRGRPRGDDIWLHVVPATRAAKQRSPLFPT